MDVSRRETEGCRGDLEAPVLAVARFAEGDPHDLRSVPDRRQEARDHDVQDRGEDHGDSDEQDCRNHGGHPFTVVSNRRPHLDLWETKDCRTTLKPSPARTKRGTAFPPAAPLL